MTGSKKQRIKIIVIHCLFGLGIGGLVTIAFVFSKKIPDTFESVMMIAVPISIVYLSYKIVKTFNKIIITEQEVAIQSILGTRDTFRRSDIEIALTISGYSINHQPFAPLLILSIKPLEGKPRNFTLAIYDDVQIENIAQMLGIIKTGDTH